MTKQRKEPNHLYVTLIATGLVATIIIGLLLVANYNATHKKSYSTATMPNHTMPYVDGEEAKRSVDTFYREYTKPNRVTSNEKLVELIGTKNLEFYNQYYQHGFDPIICSTEMPTKTDVSLSSTGPVAHVNVVASYPDKSIQTIKATVVLNDEGMDIDSITCPGDKGNLPPESN